MKIDLLAIDLAAGKSWMQIVHEERLLQKREEIRAKHRKRWLARRKHTRDFNPYHEPPGSIKGGGKFAPGQWSFKGGPHGERWQDVANQAVEEWKKANPRVDAATVAIRQDIDTAMAEAENFTSYWDWYDQHRPLAESLFGEHEPIFEKFLAAASINSGGSDNVKKAIVATVHYLLGGRFDTPQDYGGILPVEREAYMHVVRNEPLSGYKVVPFYEALMGNWDRAPADRHMKNLLFTKPNLSGGNRAQPAITEAVIGAMAHKMGWETAELQAALWCVQKSRTDVKHDRRGLGATIFSYKQYLEEAEAKVRATMHTVRAFSGTRGGPGQDSLTVDSLDDTLVLMEKQAEGYRNARLLLTFIELLRGGVIGDFNPYHEPEGSPKGGKFAKGTKRVPTVAMWHGTIDENWQSIKENGLVPDHGSGADAVMATMMGKAALQKMKAGLSKVNVYATFSRLAAFNFANIVANQQHGEPIVIRLAVPRSELIAGRFSQDPAADPDMMAVVTHQSIPPEWIKERIPVPKVRSTIGIARLNQKTGHAIGKVHELRRDADDDVDVYLVVLPGSMTSDFNPYHEPKGSARGGQFAKTITGYGQPFDVLINPSEHDLYSLAKEAYVNEIRVIIEKGNLYAWEADKAIHASIQNVLNLSQKYSDVWRLVKGKLVSMSAIPSWVTPDAEMLKGAAAIVRQELAKLKPHKYVKVDARDGVQIIGANRLRITLEHDDDAAD